MRTKVIALVLLLGFLIVGGFLSDYQPGGSIPKPAQISSAELLSAKQDLEAAYAEEDTTLLLGFLSSWHTAVKSLTVEEIQALPYPHKPAYEVYIAFYDPINLEKIGGSEWGNDIYKGVDYVLVQNDLEVHTAKLTTVLEEEITDFRPPLNFGDVTALYVTPEYKQLLVEFLDDEMVPMGTENLMAPARATGESEQRLAFLNQFIKIYHGHDEGWLIETHPYVWAIRFNPIYTRARVYFSMVYLLCYADFEKGFGGWRLINVELIAIT